MKNVKRTISILVSVFLVFGTYSGFAAKTSATNGVDKTPITLKLFVPQNSNIQNGVQNDPVAKEIFKQTGIKLDVESDSGMDKIKVMVASGDLDDITILSDVKYIEPLIKSNFIVPMDNYLKDAPNLKKYESMAIKFSRDQYSNGTGKLYVLPQRAFTENKPIINGLSGIQLRWDYYKELGCPKINNYNDLINVLAKMQKKHPTNSDGKKVYGLSTFVDWGVYAYLNNPTLEYSPLQGLNNYADYNAITNEYIPLTDDRNLLWQGADFYNKAYKADILDPESFTQGFYNEIGKTAEGRVLCQFQDWMVSSANQVLTKSTNGKAMFVNIPMADTKENPAWYSRKVPFGYTVRMAVISAKCKYPDRAVQLLDYLTSDEGARTVYNGVKGSNWDIKNGKAELLPGILEKMKNDQNWAVSQGLGLYSGIVGRENVDKSSDGQFIDLGVDPVKTVYAYTDAENEYVKFYKADTKDAVFGNRKYKFAKNEGINSLVTPLNSDMNRIAAKINEYLMPKMAQLVMTKDPTEYKKMKDQMKTDLVKMGYDQLDKYGKYNFTNIRLKLQKYGVK